jgi:hypothetical protein
MSTIKSIGQSGPSTCPHFWTEEEQVAWDSFLDLATHPLSSVYCGLFCKLLLFKIHNQNSSQENCDYVANPIDNRFPLSDETMWKKKDSGAGQT